MIDLTGAVWRKSSRSSGTGACVEVAVLPATTRWHKSSRSNGTGNCVEVASLPGAVAVRDSKDPRGPVLAVTADQWRSFVRSLDH